MHLSPEQAAALKRVTQTHKRAEQAAEAAHRAVLEAIELGVPQARVAEAGGPSRMTLWRLRKPEKPTGSRILTGANPDPRYQGPDL